MSGRTSAPVAVGVVGLVAVVAATAVVLLAPQATPEDSGPNGVETEMPTALADGSPLPAVPDELRVLADDPIVVADRRDELPDGMTCNTHLPWDGEPELESVFVTPTAASGVLVGEGSFHEMGDPNAPGAQDEAEQEQIRGNCLLLPDGNGDWSESGGGGGTAPEPGAPGTSQGAGSMCCPNGRGHAHADVSVTGDVAWLLQDRGPYWLAYPVEGLDLVTVEWPYAQSAMNSGGPPSSRIRVVDADGEVMAERLIGR